MSIKYVDLNADLGEEVTDDEAPGLLGDQVADQIGVLSEIAAGTSVRYLKPHGALYHRVMIDEEQAAAVLAASGALPVLGMPGVFVSLAESARRAVFHEGFPDRAYGRDGRLLPRSEPGAVLSDGDVIAARGVELAASADPPIASICLHGDNPGAVAHAHAVRRALEAAGWSLRGL